MISGKKGFCRSGKDWLAEGRTGLSSQRVYNEVGQGFDSQKGLQVSGIVGGLEKMGIRFEIGFIEVKEGEMGLQRSGIQLMGSGKDFSRLGMARLGICISRNGDLHLLAPSQNPNSLLNPPHSHL